VRNFVPAALFFDFEPKTLGSKTVLLKNKYLRNSFFIFYFASLLIKSFQNGKS